MGLMDKFKNLFTDEEIIEDDMEPIEIKEVKKEDVPPKLPTFMREKIEKEEKEKKELIPEFDIKRELKLESNLNIDDEEIDEINSKKLEEKSTFKFPIDFTDNDFVETRSRQSFHQKKLEEPDLKNEKERPREKMTTTATSVEEKKSVEPRVADLYKDKRPEKKEIKEKKFRATPIISPIYGVLDKNYTPIDMERTTGDNLEERRHSKSVDFDSVRKKAYGSLSEEIKENLMCENCEYLKEAKECQKEKTRKKQKEFLYDNIEEGSFRERRKDVTLDEATENYFDYGVEYEKKVEYMEEPVVEEEVKIINHDEPKRTKKEIPPVKSSINLLSTLKKSMGDEVKPTKTTEDKLELTNDLFNLIDSMYDERNENK